MDRVQKIISASGFTSRRKAEELISQGKVQVNGKTIKLGDKASSQDTITIEGQILKKPRKIYLAFNKPRGCITALEDSKFKTIFDYLKIKERVFPVGRLDFNTSGLLLLTNDGDFANNIAHPRYQIKKTYRVRIDHPLTSSQTKMIEEGILLEDGKTSPAKLFKIDSTNLEITIHEGKNRIVRRIFEQLGCKVLTLERIAIGKLELGDLKIGRYRALTPYDIERIFPKNMGKNTAERQSIKTTPEHQENDPPPEKIYQKRMPTVQNPSFKENFASKKTNDTMFSTQTPTRLPRPARETRTSPDNTAWPKEKPDRAFHTSSKYHSSPRKQKSPALTALTSFNQERKNEKYSQYSLQEQSPKNQLNPPNRFQRKPQNHVANDQSKHSTQPEQHTKLYQRDQKQTNFKPEPFRKDSTPQKNPVEEKSYYYPQKSNSPRFERFPQKNQRQDHNTRAKKPFKPKFFQENRKKNNFRNKKS